jgi:ABC-type transporter Mla MlaB component
VLKITPTRENEQSFKVRLCGQLTKEYVPEVERMLAEAAQSQTVSLDLANVTFVDRDAMVFLCSAKARNIAIENCPSYVIRWIQQERLCSGSSEIKQQYSFANSSRFPNVNSRWCEIDPLPGEASEGVAHTSS